jgi:sodium-independent sulfate anion transporter 11
MASELGPSIIFIPIVALLECISITKNFANGGSFDATQEILTLGLANILSSFVHSFPITGSFTRSAINRSAGVRTPMGGVFTSIITLLTIAFLTPAFCYVPKATLAAVIICAMIFLFELEAFIVLWKNKSKPHETFLPLSNNYFLQKWISFHS